MAPTLSKFTEVRERLVAQVVAFMGTAESNFFGRTIYYLDHPPDASETWALSPVLAIYYTPGGIAFRPDRRMVAKNTTSTCSFTFRGLTTDDWPEIEALEVDCRRAILENPGLSCSATSSLWESLSFGIEVQHKDSGQDRRCWFEATLNVEVVEDVKP